MTATTMKKLRADTCRWPIGDPKESDFHFCGDLSDGVQSYCAHHMGLAHNETRGHASSRAKKTV